MNVHDLTKTLLFVQSTVSQKRLWMETKVNKKKAFSKFYLHFRSLEVHLVHLRASVVTSWSRQHSLDHEHLLFWPCPQIVKAVTLMIFFLKKFHHWHFILFLYYWFSFQIRTIAADIIVMMIMKMESEPAYVSSRWWGPEDSFVWWFSPLPLHGFQEFKLQSSALCGKFLH